MEKTRKLKIEGVVSEYEGKYWGQQEWGNMDFGNIELAIIGKSESCKHPTDMTSRNITSEYNKLSKAKLVKVIKTITTEFEILT